MATTNDIALALRAAQQFASQAQAAASQAKAATVALNQIAANALYWTGTWSPNLYYAKYSVVVLNGISYTSIENGNKGNSPDSSPSFWQPLAPGTSSVHTGSGISGDGSSGTPVQMADIPSSTVLGRASAGTGAVEQLGPSQLTPLLLAATTSAQGAMSAADKVKLNSVPFTGYSVQFVSPSGNNSNPGTQDFPKKTAAAAFHALPGTGGVIKLTSGTEWSDGSEGLGLTSGQGCWLNGWAAPDFILPSGFLKLKPIVFEGWAPDTIEQLGDPVVTLNWGGTGSNPRLDPGLWVVSALSPVITKNVDIISRCPARLGWDYRRNGDSTIAWGNITSASRTIAGQSEFTVDFPTGFSVVTLQRTGGVTTAVLSLPNQPPSAPFAAGTTLHLTTSVSQYTSADYVLLSAAEGSPGQQIVTFADSTSPSTTSGAVAGAGSTMSGHCCAVGDIIEVQTSTSPSAQWVETSYRVLSVPDATHLIVADPASTYNTGVRTTPAGPTASIGTYVLQDRQPAQGVCLDQLENTSLTATGFDDVEFFQNGPALDRGSSTAGWWSWIKGGVFTGGQSFSANVDSERSAAVFASGGSKGVAGFQMEATRLSLGNITFSSALPYDLSLRFVTEETGGLVSYPALQVVRSSGGKIYANMVEVADGSAASIDMGQQPGLLVTVAVDSVVGSENATHISLGEARAWITESESFRAAGKLGWFADGRLSGKRDDVQSQFGVSTSLGLDNCLPQDLTTWTAVGVTVTANQPTPDGINTAYRLSGSGTIAAPSFTADTVPYVAGDHWFFGGWFKSVSGLLKQDAAGLVQGYSTPGTQPILVGFTPFGGDGEWQWVTFVGTTPSAATSDTGLSFKLGIGADTWVYMPTLLRFPAARYSANEAARIAQTYKPSPLDFPVPAAGTFGGAKLIADGGLGTNALWTVGASAGQITLGGSPNGTAVEIFGSDGHTRGVLPLYDYTINDVSTPSSIGLEGWFAPDSIQETAGLVTKWADKSGNGFDTVPISGSLKPAFSSSAINSLAGVLFDGTDQKALQNTIDNLMRVGRARSIFVVCKPTSMPGGGVYSLRRSSEVFEGFMGIGGFGQLVFCDSSVLPSTTDGAITTAGTALLAEWHADGAAGGRHLTFITAGATRTLDTPTYTSDDRGASGFIIGAQFDGNRTFNGPICEILVYNAEITNYPIELARTRAYLNTKYAL